MRKKLTILGLCGVVCFLLGAVAVETVEWIKESRVVGTASDIYSAFLDARDDFPPLPLPMGAEDVLSSMEADDFSFLNDHWFVDQTGSVLYVPKDSKLAKQLKLPLQILVVEDISQGEITIYCEDKKGEWKGLALFDAPPILDETAPFYATLSAEEKKQDLFWNLNATRIRWIATLKPESDMLKDFVFQRDAAVESMSLLEEGGMMAMMSVPPEHTNDIWISGESGSSGFDLEVYCPSGVTNIELYRCSDLITAEWTIEKTGLEAVNTNVVSWTASIGEETGFFVAGNGGLDTDQDSIPDAQEHYVQKTDPDKWDTDGDWLSDGWEITNSLDALTSDNEQDDDNDGLSNAEEYQWGTDPFDADSDDDGLSDGDEIAAGTDPNKVDTDGDSLPDAWEVRVGYDPVNVAGSLSGADQIGQFDTEGSSLAVEVRGDIAYLADGTNGLVIVDVRHPGGLELGSLSLEGEANDLLLTNDTLWVALGEHGVAAVDVSDPFRPHKLGSHYTGGYTRGLALRSNLLYLANTEKDLLILDVEYPNDIVQVGQYDHYFQEGRDVCVSGTNCWLALEDRVCQIDISDPASPTYVANAGVPSYDIQTMELFGGLLYLAGGDNFFSLWDQQERVGTMDTDRTVYGMGIESNRVLLAEGVNFVELVDVSDEENPSLIMNAIVSGFANDAALSGDRGYLAAGEGGLAVLRFSTDEDADGMDDDWEIFHFGSTNAVATNDFDSDGIFNREEYLCGTNPTNTDSDADGLSDYAEVWTHYSDPTRADGDLDGLSDYAEINTNGTQAGDFDTDGDGMPDGWEILHGFYPLIADGTGDAESDGLYNRDEYLNHTDPRENDSDGDSLSDTWEVAHGTASESSNVVLRASFEQVAVRDTHGEAHGVFVVSNTLYVADGTTGLVIFDLSIPAVPIQIGELNTDGFAADVVVSNQYAYIADGTNGLVIIAVSNSASPNIVGHYDTDGIALSVFIKGSYAYISDDDNGMPIVDVNNPLSPVQVGLRSAGNGWATDVHVEGDYAYMTTYAGNGGTLGKIDVSDPSSPSWVTGGGASSRDFLSVVVDGDYRYVGTRSVTHGPELYTYDASLDWQGDIVLPGDGENLRVKDDALYAACGNAGIVVFDLSTPASPSFEYTKVTAGYTWDVFPNGEYVYVADGSNGVAVFRFVEDVDEDGLSDFWELDHFGDLSQTATNDFDGDGISNWGEFLIAGNPVTNDADGDLLSDYAEIWTHHTQPLMADTDEDDRNDYAEVNGTGGIAATDPLDSDSDDDDLNDGAEVAYATDPHDTDTDDDEMPDGWEVANGLSPTISNAVADADSDGLLNLAEYQYGTKANDADTDDDGLEDGDEITAGTELLNPDTDGDGLTDGAEVNTHSTNPLNQHSDSDSMPDGWEVANGLSPLSNSATNDLDGDGLTNEEEYQAGSMANDTDSDDDGYNDYYEVTHDLNPASGDSDGDGIGDKDDKQPAAYEVIIPSVVTNEMSWWSDHLIDGAFSSPLTYEATYVFAPTNLPTNVTINITNVFIQGAIFDAFMINDEQFYWRPNEGCSDQRFFGYFDDNYDITELVEDTLGGPDVDGFSVDIYSWYAYDPNEVDYYPLESDEFSIIFPALFSPFQLSV